MRLPPIRRVPKRVLLPAEIDGECVFCRIVAGHGEASMVTGPGVADDDAVAFLDIQPAVVGHALVVPRRHVATLADLTAAEGAAMWELGRRVAAAARDAGIADGVNLFLADGVAAGQEVPHAHLHVLPRTRGDGLRLDGRFHRPERGALDALATRMRASLPLAD